MPGFPAPVGGSAERNLPFPRGSLRPSPLAEKPHSPVPSGKSAPIRRLRASLPSRPAASHCVTPLIQWSRTSPSYITSDPDLYLPIRLSCNQFCCMQFLCRTSGSSGSFRQKIHDCVKPFRINEVADVIG